MKPPPCCQKTVFEDNLSRISDHLIHNDGVAFLRVHIVRRVLQHHVRGVAHTDHCRGGVFEFNGADSGHGLTVDCLTVDGQHILDFPGALSAL